VYYGPSLVLFTEAVSGTVSRTYSQLTRFSLNALNKVLPRCTVRHLVHTMSTVCDVDEGAAYLFHCGSQINT
jgi:hypothetical protein